MLGFQDHFIKNNQMDRKSSEGFSNLPIRSVKTNQVSALKTFTLRPVSWKTVTFRELSVLTRLCGSKGNTYLEVQKLLDGQRL